MKITKLGHCCLVIEVKSSAAEDGGTSFRKEEGVVRIMTDPGAFSTLQNKVKNTRPNVPESARYGRVDLILFTHEHQDHFHLESLKTVLKNNPNAKIITNRGVGKLLDAEGIAYELLEDGQSRAVSGVLLEGFGTKHAVVYQEIGQVINTGYFVANRFFYPGDALYNPDKPVEILALPVAGPWVKIAEAVDYAKLLKPKVCFPVHDGMLNQFGRAVIRRVPETILPPLGISFQVIAPEESKKF